MQPLHLSKIFWYNSNWFVIAFQHFLLDDINPDYFVEGVNLYVNADQEEVFSAYELH